MRALSKIFAIAVVSIVAACGGSSEPPPTPLSRHFDDMYIAAIPLDQKQSVVQTQNDWSVAKMENAKAEADFNETTSQLAIVRNEQKASRLSIDSAIANKKSAEASADNNRINQAQVELRNAELLGKAADARVKYYETYRAFLKRKWIYTQENMYWRESQYELAKSQLAQKNNIAPKNVTYDWFPKQESERAKRAAAQRDKAEAEKQRAQNARETWQKAQQTADQSTGKPTSFPDPMAPAVQPTTAGASDSTL